MDDARKMETFRGHEWETLCEIEGHLMSEHGEGRASILLHCLLEDATYEIKIGVRMRINRPEHEASVNLGCTQCSRPHRGCGCMIKIGPHAERQPAGT